MKWLPKLRDIAKTQADPFEAALRLAIAGNIIDFTSPGGKPEENLEHHFRDALSRSLNTLGSSDAIARLKKSAETANQILYLADNAGEIVLDTLLIQQLPQNKVTLVVRDGPVANDALIEDADFAGLTTHVEVITSGLSLPGTLLTEAPDAFRHRFENADLIISKGQGNFETLDFIPGKIFFLFIVKCTSVAGSFGATCGDFVCADAVSH